jgi:hypothetical protein
MIPKKEHADAKRHLPANHHCLSIWTQCAEEAATMNRRTHRIANRYFCGVGPRDQIFEWSRDRQARDGARYGASCKLLSLVP